MSLKNIICRWIKEVGVVHQFFAHFSGEVILKEMVETHLQANLHGAFLIVLGFMIIGEMLLLRNQFSVGIQQVMESRFLNIQLMGFIAFDLLMSVMM